MPRPRQTDEERAAAAAAARQRILEAFGALIREQGYAATTMSDVAARAKVSKSTLYGQFGSRDEVLLALYDRLTDVVLEAIRAVDDPLHARAAPWRERISAGIEVYVRLLLSGGEISRSMMVDVPAAGQAGIAARRAVLDRYATLVGERINEELRLANQNEPVSHDVLVAVAGGIHELVLRAVEAEGTPDVAGVRAAAEQLLIGAIALSDTPTSSRFDAAG